MAAPYALRGRGLKYTPELVVALAAASAAAFAPPALSTGIGLTLLFTLAVARLDLPRALAIVWGMAIIPVYVDLPGFGFPAELIVGPVLLVRTFLMERRRLTLPSYFDWLVLAAVVGGMAVSAGLSGAPRQAAYYSLRSLCWLLYIPASIAIIRHRRDAAPALAVILLGATFQAVLGLAQLALNNDFTVAILELPVASAFMPGGSLQAKLANQDFNWITFDRAFPSGLFLNSIVYGVCLSIWGMILLSIPVTALSGRRIGPWRAAGALALIVGFLTFKLTVWLGIIAGGMTFILMRIADPKVRARVLTIPPLVLLAIGFALQDYIAQRLEDIATGSLFTRVLAWRIYLMNLPYQGLIGLGLGQAGLLAPSILTKAAGETLSLELAPESSAVGLAVEIGVPAMIALHVLLIAMTLNRRPLRASWALPVMVTALVSNLGVFGLTDDHIGPLVTLLAGLAAAWERTAA